jgi:hypothetical protein
MGLTDRQIRPPRSGGPQPTRAPGRPRSGGSSCRVYKTGVRSWFVFYRRKEDNRRRIFKLGEYPGVSLAQARELAEVELGKIAAGEDPQAERRSPGAGPGPRPWPSSPRLPGGVRQGPEARPRATDGPLAARHLRPPPVGRAADHEITKGTSAAPRGPGQTASSPPGGKPTKVAPRNLRAVLSKMFDWAADRASSPATRPPASSSPCRVREHQKKGGRDRVLSDEEIGVLWGELDRLEEAAVAGSIRRSRPPPSG